jgi:hypothetical protein
MAKRIIPSSFECDCGHLSHFFERTIWEMEADSRRRRKPIRILDSEREEHAIEFLGGKAVAVICPRLGRCEIAGWP